MTQGLVSSGLRLSPSAKELFNKCPRLFYLKRVLNISNEPEEELEARGFHLDYGNAAEAGTVSYLQHGSIDRAVYDAWLAFGNREAKNKTLESLVAGIRTFAMQWPQDEWKLEAAQVGFKLEFGDDFGGYYCGYIDAAIINQFTGHSAALECKTTGYRIQPIEALYQNSEQAVAYPTILAYLRSLQGSVAPAYACLYVIYNVAAGWIPQVELKSFHKPKVLMLEWLLNLKMDYEQLKQYHSIEMWPMRGHNCIQYNRPCEMFGICHLSSLQTEAQTSTPTKPTRENSFEHVIQFDDLFQWVLSQPGAT